MVVFDKNAPDIANEALIKDYISGYFDEVRKLLLELPDDIYIWLDNWHLIAETGVGGYAHSPNTMTISFDPNFKDKEKQKMALRGTVFHEAYHLVQGVTQENPKAERGTALDMAIYEGCATVFERQYAEVSPKWGDYAQHDRDTLKTWRELLENTTFDRYVNEEGLRDKLAFYDKESGERWRLYKVGTWLVDEALKKSGLDILDLRTKNADEIISL